MAEFGKLMEQFKRMCTWENAYPKYCDNCPMGGGGRGNISHCRKVAFDEPARFEEVVTQWVKDHPLPIYPKWADYLTGLVIQDVIDGKIHETNLLEYVLNQPIPEDIAKKLGIRLKY